MPDAPYQAEDLVNIFVAHGKHSSHTTEHSSAGQQKNMWII